VALRSPLPPTAIQEPLPGPPRSLSVPARRHYLRLRRALNGRATRGDVSAVMLVATALAVALDDPPEGSARPTTAEKSGAWASAMRGLAIFALVPSQRVANGSTSASSGVDVGVYIALRPPA
jgi:hypothetical protein